MSFKILIPEVSDEYKQEIYNYITEQGYNHVDLGELLNDVSGACQKVEISSSLSGIGGCLTLVELQEKSSGFTLATIKEFIKFHNQEYTDCDFIHIFLNFYYSVALDYLFGNSVEIRDRSMK
jgi:hypothetical protein